MKKIITSFLLLAFPLLASAYDIAVTNADGVTIYYNYYNNGTELQVTNDITNQNSYSGVVNIPEEVLYMNIARKVTSIESGAFWTCTGLTSVTIPNSVTIIGSRAFCNCSNLTSVSIPSSIKIIGESAFRNCSKINSVIILGAVTEIRNDAFYGCNDLKKVIVKDIAAWCSVIFSNFSSNPLNYAHHLFSDNNKEIKDMVIPNSVTIINNYAFSGCSGLTSVTIPNSVTSIGEWAFRDCSSLTSVAIPNSVTSIGGWAFSYCSGLTSMTIPNSVTSIEGYTFSGCSGLTSVTIPNSVTSIGYDAFSGCSGLTSIAIPNSVTSIGEWAFNGCSSLSSVAIPNSVTSIGGGAFQNCTGLTSVTIPNSVTSIGGWAFSGCEGLSSVHITDLSAWCNLSFSFDANPLTYAHHLFLNGEEIKDLVIPSSVTCVGDSVFCNCSNIKTVTIPNSVTYLGNEAFTGCKGLTKIYSMISEPFWVDCWYGVDKDIPLYVPVGSKAKYQATAGWKEFTNIIEIDVSTQNTLSLDDLTGYVGKTVTLPIQMNNKQQITGLQFDLYLPEGVTVAKKANGKNDITVTDRMDDGYSLSSNMMEDGCVRVTGLSMESTPFTGNDGSIINVVLQIDESAADGDYQIQVKNIILSDVTGVAHKPASASCMLSVKSYIPGDVDGSEDININDAVCIVNYILNKPNVKFIIEAADLDGSGDININDAVVLINKFILKKTNAKAMKAPRRAATGNDNYLSIDAVSIKPGETKALSVCMTNTESIQGLQCNIELPEGLSFSTKANGKIDIANDADRGDGFTLSGNLQENGSLTVATVNFDGDTYYGNSGTIFTFKITADEGMAAGEYEIKVRDIVLSSGVAIKPSDTTGKVTVESSQTSIQQIESNDNASDQIYNLSGQRVKAPLHGIYVKNGRKVIVK